MPFASPAQAANGILTALLASGRTNCRVEITGNSQISTTKLFEGIAIELAEFEISHCSKAKADDTAFALENIYRQAGFSSSIVTYEHTADGDAAGAQFFVEEGPKTLVGAISFANHDFFSAVELAQMVPTQTQPGTPFITTAVQGITTAIRDAYYGEGFLTVEVADPVITFSPDQKTAAVSITISEGIRQLIDGIDYSGDILPEIRQELDKAAAELNGSPYFPRRRLTLRHRIQELYSNLGYARATITVQERHDESGLVRLTVTVNKGEQVRVTAISVTGNERTRETFIRSRLTLAEQDIYSQAARRESFRALYRTGLFSRVTITLQDDNSLQVEVTEKPAIEVFVEPGWGSYEMLRFGFGMRHRNIWGTGRVLNTIGRISVMGENVELGITDPWFFKSGITADLPINFTRREEPSFTRQEVSASFFLSKGFGENITATTGYTQRRTDISDIDAAAAAAEPESGYNIGAVSGRLTYDTKNDIFFPTDGVRLSLGAELADEYLASTINYLRMTGSARFYRYLGAGIITGLRYETGIMLPGREKTPLPLSERFYSGGDNSVRSFKESQLGPMAGGTDPLGGLAYNVISVELRKRLVGNLAGSVFIDLGNVAPNLAPDGSDDPSDGERSEIIGRTLDQYFRDLRLGIGCGLQYLLPVGPARLDVAFNPTRRAESNEPSVVVHLTVGMAF